MSSRLHRWRRTAAASAALFLAALALLAGRVRAGADPALGPARSSSSTATTPADGRSGASSADGTGTPAATDGSDASSSADLPATGAS
jgi:hypothetical protein